MNKIHVRQVTLKTINATVPKKINTREMLTKKNFMQLENPPPPQLFLKLEESKILSNFY